MNIAQSKQEIILTVLVSMILVAFFSAGLAISQFTSSAYHLLAFVGLLLVVFQRWLPFSGKLSQPLRIWLYIGLAYCLVGIISWLANGLLAEQAKWLGLQGKFLILPLAVWALACAFKKPCQLRYILFALFTVGAIAAGLLGLDSRYELVGVMPHEYRVGLGVNPIYYGDTALVMGFVSGIFAIYWARQNRYVLCSIGVLALGLGLISSGLSISRGGWLALPIFLAFLLYYLLHHKYYLVSALGVMIALAIVGWVLTDTTSPIHQRIFEGKQNLEQFDLETSRTSAGYRLRMWHHALELSKQKPIIGHGPMSYVFNDYDEKGEIVQFFHHAHSGYLQTLSTLGIVGFISYLALFLFPLNYFWRSWRENSAPEIAMSGMVLISSYMVFVLTDVIFYRSVGLLYFLLMVSLLILLIEREKQQNMQDVAVE